MDRRVWREGGRTALAVVMLVAFWMAFAPVQLGGSAAYVIVAGASMDPALRRGDLVITRPSAEYDVGEIVAYRHPSIGPVIHRILAVGDGVFILKGDANSWTDSYEPAAKDIIGRSWIRLRGAGAMLAWLRQPPMMIVTTLVISVLLVTTVVPMNASQKRSRMMPGRGFIAGLGTDGLQALVSALALISLASLILAGMAWTRPAVVDGVRSMPYEQRGVFTYSAEASRDVYGASRLETGDPIYFRLTETVDVRFDYHFAADAPHAVQGHGQLTAVLSDPNGWNRTLVLQDARPFSGDGASVFGKLDLTDVTSILTDLENQTGVTRPFYTLTIVPAIDVRGDLAGQPLQSRFAPELKFMVDKLQMQLLPPDESAPESDPLRPREAEAMDAPAREANRLTIFGLSLPVSGARAASLAGLLVGGGGLGLLAAWMERTRREDPAAAIRMKYGASLADVAAGADEAGAAAVDVATIDDLMRIAEKLSQPVLARSAGSIVEYSVHAAECTYRYRLAHEPAGGRDPGEGGG